MSTSDPSIVSVDVIAFEVPRDFSLPSSGSVPESIKSNLFHLAEDSILSPPDPPKIVPESTLAQGRRRTPNLTLLSAARIPWEVEEVAAVNVEPTPKICSDLKFASLLDASKVTYAGWITGCTSNESKSGASFVTRCIYAFCFYPRPASASPTVSAYWEALLQAAGQSSDFDTVAAFSEIKEKKAKFFWKQLGHPSDAWRDAVFPPRPPNSELSRDFLPQLHNVCVILGVRMTVFAVFFGDPLPQIPTLQSIDLGDGRSKHRLFTGYAPNPPGLILADPWGPVPPPVSSVPPDLSSIPPDEPSVWDVFETLFTPLVSPSLQREVMPTGAPIVSPAGGVDVQPVVDPIKCPEGVHPVAIVKRERECGYWFRPDSNNSQIYLSTLFRMRRFVAADNPPRFDWAKLIQENPKAPSALQSFRAPASLAFAQVAHLDKKEKPPTDGSDQENEVPGQVGVESPNGPLISNPGEDVSWGSDDAYLQFRLTDCLYCVHPLSPLNQLGERPLFTLRGTSSFAVKRVYLYSTTAFFAVAEDGDRTAVVILGGRPGDQSLDDLYVCAEIPNATYKSSAVAIPRACAQRPVQVPVIGVLVNENGQDVCFAFVITAEGDPVALLKSLGKVELEKAATSIQSPPCDGLTNGFAVFNGDSCIASVQFTDELADFRVAPAVQGVLVNGDLLLKWALRWDDHFDQGKTTVNSVGETVARLLGFEVDDALFLVIQNRRDGDWSRYYSPGSRNVVLRADIHSLYNRFYWHAPDDVLSDTENSRLLITVVDIGSLDSTRRCFQAGTAPGLYCKFCNTGEGSDPQEDGVFRYAGEDGDVRSYPTWWLYFNNGGLPVGLSFHRTICQLFAAFCCAAVIRVYGPGMIVRDFRLSSPLFDLVSFREARSRLIATYGTLLKVGKKNLTFAARELATTRTNIGSFKNFLRQLDPDWYGKFADQFLPEGGLEERFPLAAA